MSKKKRYKPFLLILMIIILSSLFFIFPKILYEFYAQQRLFDEDETPSKQIAIVFGAGLLRDGTPTRVLEDRVVTATELYMTGKVKKLLMSGDNRFVDYNEPAAMKSLAVVLGVPEEDIIMDFAGRRTYDTCYRAGYIFQIEEAILITQRYHQPRAIFTCNKLGINAIGVSSDRRNYQQHAHRFWSVREVFASFVAFFDLYITHPTPVLGEPEPIMLNK